MPKFLNIIFEYLFFFIKKSDIQTFQNKNRLWMSVLNIFFFPTVRERSKFFFIFYFVIITTLNKWETQRPRMNSPKQNISLFILAAPTPPVPVGCCCSTRRLLLLVALSRYPVLLVLLRPSPAALPRLAVSPRFHPATAAAKKKERKEKMNRWHFNIFVLDWTYIFHSKILKLIPYFDDYFSKKYIKKNKWPCRSVVYVLCNVCMIDPCWAANQRNWKFILLNWGRYVNL